MRAYGSNGKVYDLSDKPLASGGEGSVHEVLRDAGIVAKLYKDAATASPRKGKIEAMVRGKAPLSGNIAWPKTALYSDPDCRTFVGFTMDRVPSRRNVSALYAYPGPAIPMDVKLCVAESIASATEAVHAAGHVIGDFNDNDIMVLKGGGVAIVDCDSFDVRAGSSHYPCTVCMGGYAAPEALAASAGTTYEDAAKAGKTVFTEHTDNWALAVHIFRMIMNGVHPYHCVPVLVPGESAPVPLSTDKRVRRGETPFFTKVAGATAAPFVPSVSSLPPYIRCLFKRAFVAGHRHPSRRPKPAEWIAALERYRNELAVCAANPTHHYWTGTPACPYCEADARCAAKAGKKSAAAPAHVKTASAAGAPKVVPAQKKAPAPLAAAAQASKPPLRPWQFWALSLVGAFLIALVISALPPFSSLFASLFGGYNPILMAAIMAAGAIGAAALYNHFAEDGSLGRLGVSEALAAGGAVLSLPLAAGIWFVLKAVAAAAAAALVIAALISIALN